MHGMQVFDEQGGLTLDVSDRITKILGEIVIPKDTEEDSGTIQVPDLALGTPFYFTAGNEAEKTGWFDKKGWAHGFWPAKDSDQNLTGGFYPQNALPAYQVEVTFEGTTLTWSVKKYSQWWVGILNDSFKILYGVY